MRDLHTCKAEVLRRSQKKIKERKRRRNSLLSLCLVVCMCATCWAASVAFSPSRPAQNGGTYGTDGVWNTLSLDGETDGMICGSLGYGNANGLGGSKGDSNANGTNGSKGDGNINEATSQPLPPSAGETGRLPTKNLMQGISARKVNASKDLSAQNAAVSDFAIRVFQASSENGKNTLVSPLSVLCALSMTANGAQGETLTQMEKTLGLSASELNQYLYSYLQSLPTDEKSKLDLANSIWFTADPRFTVEQGFLQTNADYYGADIYQAPFDEQTCEDINNWVKQKTDGMIPSILDEIPSNAVMYLINALAFDAEWDEIYKSTQVRDGRFTKEDGTWRSAVYMNSIEDAYLEDAKATGFMKYYAGRKYAFVAMLPNEGVSVADYVASLDGASLQAMLKNPVWDNVSVSIPKFETEYDVEMSKILQSMGMSRAFNDGLAEFQGLGRSTAGNIYIGQILHKTFISVSEKGTKAGAVTSVGMEDEALEMWAEKRVSLNRPFVYMLVDCENNIPFFIGTMMDPAA